MTSEGPVVGFLLWYLLGYLAGGIKCHLHVYGLSLVYLSGFAGGRMCRCFAFKKIQKFKVVTHFDHFYEKIFIVQNLGFVEEKEEHLIIYHDQNQNWYYSNNNNEKNCSVF